MTTENGQNDWVKDAERVFQKSVEANKQMLEESAAAVSHLFSGKSNKLAPEAVGEVMSDWARLNLRYTERLIDLGLEWSRSVAKLLERQATTTDDDTPERREAAPPPPPAAPIEKHEIVITGNAGETIATSLQLQSSRPGTQKGRFEATPFRHEGTGKLVDFALSFDPERFSIPPGEVVPATITVAVPENTAPAVYRSSVTVHGFEDAAFDLVLQVNRLAAKPRQAVAKKTAKKKS